MIAADVMNRELKRLFLQRRNNQNLVELYWFVSSTFHVVTRVQYSIASQ